MNMLMSGYKEMSMLMLCALQRRSAHLSAPGAPVRLQMRRPLVRLLKKISSTPGRLLKASESVVRSVQDSYRHSPAPPAVALSQGFGGDPPADMMS
jgi:hypothetical protein